ncbi:MAG: Glu/Leu/Phe/Val dehydrogenase, partial [Acidobacteriota bacterium]|nr:Glu/Leu/Phe/Val dehydrogenase [Acidobacteriota bacterium]
LVEATEDLVGRQIPERARRRLLRDMGEEDLVNSGLEETMTSAYNEILEVMRRKRSINDLRTASYVVALEKVGTSYLQLGIFP